MCFSFCCFSERNHTDIKHSYDIWHGGKNLGKKLAAVCLSTFCPPTCIVFFVIPEFCGRDRENEPLDPTLSNLVHIILMVSGRALLLFKVMSPRSRSVWWLVLGSENKPLDPPMSKLVSGRTILLFNIMG